VSANFVRWLSLSSDAILCLFMIENEIRYTPFNPDELVKIACEAAGARSCKVFTKPEEEG
jgi:hypothetical protein